VGLAIDRDQFDPVDYQRFEERLQESLLALGRAPRAAWLRRRADHGRRRAGAVPDRPAGARPAAQPGAPPTPSLPNHQLSEPGCQHDADQRFRRVHLSE
jgi:hypothetical protein